MWVSPSWESQPHVHSHLLPIRHIRMGFGPGTLPYQETEFMQSTSGLCPFMGISGLPWWLGGKESTCNAGDLNLIPGLGRPPGVGNGNPLQYSCLGNPMNRRALAGCTGWQNARHDLATKQQQQWELLPSFRFILF